MTVGQDRLQRCKDRGAQRGQVSDSGRVPRRLKPEHDRKAHDRPRLGAPARAFAPVGRFVLLRRRRRARDPAADPRRAPGRHRRARAGDRPQGDGRIPAPLAAGPRRVRRHGFSQQRGAVHPHRLRSDANSERACGHSQRHDAALHRARRACLHPRRAHHAGKARRRRRRLPRRRRDDRAVPRRCRGGTDGSAARLPRGRALLCLRGGLRPPLQGPRRQAACRGDRAGRRLDADAAAARTRRRPALDAAAAWPRRTRRGARPRAALDGAGLCALFPPARQRRRDEISCSSPSSSR